jgi:hypothetical protein
MNKVIKTIIIVFSVIGIGLFSGISTAYMVDESEEGQKQYNDLKEEYITTFTQGLAGKLSESEVREIVEGVFEEPSIMKEFEEAYQYADEPSELPQFTKHFEEWMSSVGSRITEKLAEVTVN